MELEPWLALPSTAVGYVAHKVLGPSLADCGSWVQERLSPFRRRNVEKIVQGAADLVGPALDQPGAVHPRVAHRLLDEGSYIDDSVMSAYLSGLLASARTPDGKDDRSAYYVNIVAGLTTRQVRLHHAVYSAVAAQRPPAVNLRVDEGRNKVCVLASGRQAAELMTPGPAEAGGHLLSEAATGLAREALITGVSSFDAAGLLALRVELEPPAFAIAPSALGILLFLWARGVATADPDELGRTPLAALDPPGPTLTRPLLGPWLPGPATRADLERVEGRALANTLMFGGM